MENRNSFTCPICGNTDIHSIGYLNGKPYCRRCISFRGEEAEHKPSYPKKAPIHLEYELSPEQKELSDKLVENYKKGIDSLVYAVCGSGKTEICLECIRYSISKGMKVGFAVPRRSVCVEIMLRLREIFNKNTIVAVYGGHTSKLEGDIVCLTTHQLFRYKEYFDLLIMDEVDAFPYKGDFVLEKLFYQSIKRNYILLSATPSKKLIKQHKKEGKNVLELFSRFHRHPLPVPSVKCGNVIYLYYKLLYYLKHFLSDNKQVFVFVPTIKMSNRIVVFLRLFLPKGKVINSKTKNNEKTLQDFKNKKIKYLVTTAVLERGITVKDLQVIVFRSDNSIYDKATLIQIAGRVGRKKTAPEGEVIFLAKKNTRSMQRAVEEIISANQKLQNMLQKNKNR